MFGLNEAHYNIVKRAAKACSEDIKEEIKGGHKYDHIAAKKISKHYGEISTLVTRSQFIWIMGYLNGRFGRVGEYE